MAYSNETTTTNNTKNKPQALSFINLHMPANNEAGKKKVGYIALNAGDADLQAIHDHLVAHPEDVAKFIKNLIVDFRENKPAEKSVDVASLFA